jgi:hypothetical protein
VNAPGQYTRVALGIYATNSAAHNWQDSWASEQKTLTGTAPKVVHCFKPFVATPPEGGAWAAFDPAWADDALANGAVPLITWEGRDLSKSGSAAQPTYSNASVVSGYWDATLIAWLNTVKAWGKRLILRPMHELNGQWMPHAAGCNGNTAESCIAAWRHLARLVRQYAPLVELCWCPGTSGSGWISFEDTYPGAAYVDWLGCDYYNCSNLPGSWTNGWVEFAAIQPYYDRLCLLDPAKGIIVAETGCVPDATHSKAAWYTNLVSACATMPRIRAVVAFDNTYGALDFRVSADAAVVYPAWKALAADPRMQGSL